MTTTVVLARESGAAGGRRGGGGGGGGGGGDGGGGVAIPDPGPSWPRVAAKSWGMGVSPGSAWSIAGGGGGGGGVGYTASPHHVNSTELAMSLYAAGGTGTRSRSPTRRG